MTVAVKECRGQAAPLTRFYPFASFSPTRLKLTPKGLLLDGQLSATVEASLRLDKARRTFFVTTRTVGRDADEERPMSGNELKGLLESVSRLLASSTQEQAEYKKLHQAVRTALAELEGSTYLSKVPTHVARNGADAGVEGALWVDLVPVRGAALSPVYGQVTLKGVGQNDAPPSFKVETIGVFEQGSHAQVAVLRTPAVADERTLRGQKMQTYRIEIPRSKVDQEQRYVLVVNVSINGAPPVKVRSDYVTLGKVY